MAPNEKLHKNIFLRDGGAHVIVKPTDTELYFKFDGGGEMRFSCGGDLLLDDAEKLIGLLQEGIAAVRENLVAMSKAKADEERGTVAATSDGEAR